MIEVALTRSDVGTSPASTSGRISRMKPVAWQPGLAMRLLVAQPLALVWRELGQAEDPAGAVRCAVLASMRQVLRVRHQRDRLARRRVGQAQERDVGRVQQTCALGRVLAQLGRDAQHLDVVALREVFVDAQAGRAFLAVDENAVLHGGSSSGEAWHSMSDARAPMSRRSASRAAAIDPRNRADGDEETEGPRPRPRGAARARASGATADSRRRADGDAAARCRSSSCSRAATSRARAWTRARSYELAESIKAQGIMQPILVRRLARRRRRHATRSSPASAASARRGWRAWTSVPVLVRDVPDEAAAAMALIENIQREDLNPLEEAQGLQRLIDEFGLTHEQAAQAVGRSRSAASAICCAC